MYEGTPITWVWMGFPIIGLALNLVYPRWRSVQLLFLAGLMLTAWFHGTMGGMMPLKRAVAMTERALSKATTVEPREVLLFLRSAQATAEQTVYDIWLGLSIGVILAVLPLNLLSRRFPKLESIPTDW